MFVSLFGLLLVSTSTFLYVSNSTAIARSSPDVTLPTFYLKIPRFQLERIVLSLISICYRVLPNIQVRGREAPKRIGTQARALQILYTWSYTVYIQVQFNSAPSRLNSQTKNL